MAKVMGDSDLSTPNIAETPRPILMNLDIYKCLFIYFVRLTHKISTLVTST